MGITTILEHLHQEKRIEETFPFNEETLVLKVSVKLFTLIFRG